MAEVSGFFYPRTATGRSSLLPPPPWHYSGDLLTVEYRTDPARVAELLPGPLQPAPEDPGAVALIWADWQSCGDAGEELLDPVRAQYRECFAVVRCAFDGRVYSRCVYIWVDADFALVRGLHQGYPKKLGSIHQTRAHPFGRAAPKIAPGGTFAGTLAAADRRLAQAVVTLRAESPTAGLVNAPPMAHHRWMPSIEKVRLLQKLCSIGMTSSWTFVMEFFGWRKFENRRQVAGALGITPMPYQSGESSREQGISRSGNRRMRSMAVEIAWTWLRLQPNSKLSQWYQARFGGGGARMRRIGIVAMARRLASVSRQPVRPQPQT